MDFSLKDFTFQKRQLYRARQNACVELLAQQGVSQSFICDPLSIFYLTGYFTEPIERFLGLLLIDGSAAGSTNTGNSGNSSAMKNQASTRSFTLQKQADLSAQTRALLFCNELFPSAYALKDAEVIDELFIFKDTDTPLELLALNLDPQKVLGIDKDMQARWLVPLLSSHNLSELKLASDAVDALRSIKAPEELAALREASRLNDLAMDWLCHNVREGVSELELAQELLGAYLELGADGASFDPIISFGASHCADPHHEPNSQRLKKGQQIIFDIGCKKDWYCSDMTRSFFFGSATELDKRVYATVKRANEAAEAVVRPGVLFSEIDRAARSVIEEAGFGKYFTHRLGHQIGLSVHEPGDVSSSHHEPVQEGMVFSIEPGIYIPDTVGVRLEDLVIVTSDGCEVINHYPKEPTIL